MLNKKGQDSDPKGWVVGLIIAAIVLVLVVIFVVPNWNDITTSIGNIFSSGGGLESNAVTACINENGASPSYCADLKTIKVSGKKEYVTCNSERIKSQLSADKQFNCDNYKDNIVESCKAIKEDTFTINGIAITNKNTECSLRFGLGKTCGIAGGTWLAPVIVSNVKVCPDVIAAKAAESDLTSQVTDTNDKPNANALCCKITCASVGGAWSTIKCVTGNDLTVKVKDTADKPISAFCCKNSV